MSGLNPFQRSRFTYQFIFISFTISSEAILRFVNLAPNFRGRSVQSLRACPAAPQFSQAPLRYELDWNPFSPRLYQS